MKGHREEVEKMGGLRPLEGELSAVGGCKLEVGGGKIDDGKVGIPEVRCQRSGAGWLDD